MGLKTAYSLLEQHKTISNVITALKAKDKDCIPGDYESRFEKAYLAFRFPRVWCPILKAQVYLNDLPSFNQEDTLEGKTLVGDMEAFLDKTKLSYERRLLSKHYLEGIVGSLESKPIAQLLSEGKLHPITKFHFEASEYCCVRPGCISKKKSNFVQETQITISHQGSNLSFPFKNSFFSRVSTQKEEEAIALKKRKPETQPSLTDKIERDETSTYLSQHTNNKTRAIISLFGIK